MRIEYETRGLIRFREMRIHFGMILSILMKQRINENMVWTDSQDYGADEILYTIGTVLFNINNRLMREITILFEVYTRLFRICMVISYFTEKTVPIFSSNGPIKADALGLLVHDIVNV